MIPTVTLPRGRSVRAAADACRAALESFGSLEPTHLALAGWMSTYYKDALVGHHDAAPFSTQFSTPVERVIDDAKRRLAELRREARDPAATFVTTLPARVNIARVRDEDGNVGVGPVDVRGAGLEVRVVSLFLADYLSRPEHYIASAAPELWWVTSDA